MHACPVVTEASVAKHSWNIAVLFYALYPFEPRVEFIFAMLLHDSAERWTGDVPGPAKYHNPDLYRELKAVEERVGTELGIELHLTDQEKTWLKSLDWLEFMMFCEDELAMGNRNVEPSLENIRRQLQLDWVPRAVAEFAARYRWSRTSDYGGDIVRQITKEEAL